MTLKFCAVIPTHNHWTALADLIADLRQRGLPILLIDDGSSEPARSAIAAHHDPDGQVEVFRLSTNLGKGGAVKTALRLAYDAGFTHAVQLDADGQHDLASLSTLMDLARANPSALVSGRPVYDASMPRARRIARWITHVWVWIETLSTRITDSMCGFRVYPLAATVKLIDTVSIGSRMDFDPEIMVRLFWRGVPALHVPVKVDYPSDNHSNFRLLKDNWLITAMHTRLVLAMLISLPTILRHRPVYADPALHWSALAESGTALGMRTLSLIYRLIGRPGTMAIAAVIAGYVFLTDRTRRAHSMAYLQRVRAAKGLPPATWRDGYRHFLSFAAKALDTFVAWSAPERVGPIKVEGAEPLDRLIQEGRGVLLIVSHHGNAELSRATLNGRFKQAIHPLLYTRHAQRYNRLIRSIRPDAETDTIEVDDIGPETAIALKQRIDNGDWIAIAGDRTPISGTMRTVSVGFLGEPAPFSTGPYILAALMGCPVYLLDCVSTGTGHEVRFELFSDRIVLPRGDRHAALVALAQRFAGHLEQQCLAAPLQFYNFFDFWAHDSTGQTGATEQAGSTNRILPPPASIASQNKLQPRD